MNAELVIVFNAVLGGLVLVAGVWAWRRVYSQAVSLAQDRVIGIQKTEIEALTSQVASLTKEVSRQRQTIATVRYVLKRQGIEIMIEDDYVTVRSTQQPKDTTIRIRREDILQSAEKNDTELVVDEVTNKGSNI